MRTYRERWLVGEKETAEQLTRRTGRVLDNTPDRPVRQCLTATAADSLLPDVAVEYMVRVAQEEVLNGLEGPLRRQIADADVHDTGRLNSFRDAVMEACGFSPDGLGACQLNVQLIAQRAVGRLADPIPAAVAASIIVVGLGGWGSKLPQVSIVIDEARRLLLNWQNAEGDAGPESEEIRSYLSSIVERRIDLASADI